MTDEKVETPRVDAAHSAYAEWCDGRTLQIWKEGDPDDGWDIARQLERELSVLRAELERVKGGLEVMRVLAANPHTIQKVKDEFGPLSLWTKDGLDREIAKHVAQADQRATTAEAALEKARENEGRVIASARELESWLGKVVGSDDGAQVEIRATDIGGEGTRQRLQALADALKRLDAAIDAARGEGK